MKKDYADMKEVYEIINVLQIQQPGSEADAESRTAEEAKAAAQRA